MSITMMALTDVLTGLVVVHLRGRRLTTKPAASILAATSVRVGAGA